MQNTSALYKSILSGNHTKEVCLDVYNSDGSVFVGRFGMNRLTSMTTSRGLLKDDGGFTIGCCIGGKISVSFYPLDDNNSDVKIPRMARIEPLVRLVPESGEKSEWIHKGIFYVDTRDENKPSGIVTLDGYDAMLKAEADFPVDRETEFPASDKDVVDLIAETIGVDVDSRVYNVVGGTHQISTPIGYSCREVLSYIGMINCCNFCISDEGKLLAFGVVGISRPAYYLTDELGNNITFGGARIIV